jgi:MFS family permease
VLGPIAGGALTQAASWRWIFYLNIPLGLLALVAVSLFLRIPRPTRSSRVDWLGAVLLIVAVSAVMLGLLGATPASGWPTLATVAMVGAGLACAVAFIRVQGRSADPLLPLGIITHPVVRITAILGLVVGLTTVGTIVYAPAYLQGVLGASPATSGLQLLPFVGGTLFSAILVGRMVSRHGTYRIYPIIGTVIATIGLGLLSRLGVDSGYVLAAVGLALVGVGLGAVMPVLTVAAQSAVEHKDIGVVTSTSSLARSLGSTFGATAFGLVWGLSLSGTSQELFGSATSPAALAAATQLTFLVATLIMGLAVVAAIRLPSVQLRTTTVDSPSQS